MPRPKTPQQGQDPGAPAAPSNVPTSEPAPTPPASGAAPKFCPSCGKPTTEYVAGKSAYCDACEHVFDAAGQGRKADLRDQITLLQNQVRDLRAGGVKDPRVDKIDDLVKKLTASMGGAPVGIDDIDPGNPQHVSKFQMLGAMLQASPLRAFFQPRQKAAPAPAAAPATPPAGKP